jgi:hypothetical protein
MKKYLLTFILLASFTLGGHVAFAQTAQGSVQPGGACTTDPDCADVGGQNYGCINKQCTLDTATQTGSAAEGSIQPGDSCTADTDCADVGGANYACLPEGGPNSVCTAETLDGSTSNGATTVAAPSSNTAATTVQGAKCSLGDVGCYLTNGLIGILSTAAYYIMTMVGFLLGLVGTVFNWVVVITVFQYAVYFGNSAGMLVAWGILRDLGNIVLLFGFIFMGIMVILNLDSIDAKKALPRLLIFAVLLNFSLFASEAIVDVANVFSAVLYKQAGQSTLGSPTTVQSTGTTASGFTQVGIAGAIMHDTYMDSAFNPSKPPINSTVQQLLAFIGTTVFMLIVMVLLLAASVIFFMRAVMLTFLLVVSPLGFAGMAIDRFQDMAKKWFNQLLSNAFFAPVFLLLMFIGLKVLEAARTSLGGGANASLASSLSNPSSSVGGIFIIFGLTIGFFIAALNYAKSSSVAGAGMATTFAQNTVQRGFTAPFRAAHKVTSAAVVRPVAGGLAAGASKRYNTMMGNLKSQGGMVGGLAKQFDYTAGGAIEGALHKVQTTKFAGTRSYEEEKKHRAGRDHETSHAVHAAETAALKAEFKTGLANSRNPGGTTDAAERAMQKLSTADTGSLLTTLNDADLAVASKLLSSDKLDSILNDKDFNEQVKEKIVHARFGDFEAALDAHKAAPTQANFKTVQSIARKLTGKETKILATHSDLFDRAAAITDDANVAGGTGDSIWTNNQIDDINKNEAFTTRQRANVFGTKKSEQLKNATTGVAIANLSKSIGKDIADVPSTVLIKPEVAAGMTREKLAAIMAKEELADPADRETIRNNIFNYFSDFAKGTAEDRVYEDMRNYLNTNAIARGWWGDRLP